MKSIETGVEDGNCNSCVVAYEFCRRGYSVNAGSTLINSTVKDLAENGLSLWLDAQEAVRDIPPKIIRIDNKVINPRFLGVLER